MVEKAPSLLESRDTLYWLALTGLLLGFFLWSINHLGGFAWDDDEGIFLMTGKLVQLGYPLYTEVWFNYPPAFFVFVATAFKLLGCSVAVGRSVVVLFATMGLLGVALVARQLSDRLGALCAVILLALAPHFLKLSRAAVAEVPAIALATLSIAFVLYYLRTGRRLRRTQSSRRWLILAGVAFSVSLLVKLITAFTIVPLALAIPLRRSSEQALRRSGPRSWMEMAKDLGILALAVAIPILLCLVIFDGRAFLDQVVGTYLRGKEVYPLDIAQNVDKMLTFLSGKYGLLALSLYGIVFAATAPSLSMERRKGVLIVTGWLCFTAIFLLIHSPLRPKHLILLLFPLAILSGIAVGELVSSLGHLVARPLSFDPSAEPVLSFVEGLRACLAQGRSQRALLLLGLIALGLYILELPEMIREGQELLRQDEEDELGHEAVRFVKTMTEPEDFVITDEPMIAFRASRKVPPPLSNISKMRIETGHLTAGELIALTKEYKPKAIIFWEHRLHQLPAYVHWVKHHYLFAEQLRGDTRQTYVPSDSHVGIQHAQRANLGNQVELLGYSLDDTIIEPGGTIHLTLFWQARKEMDISYTVFVHLLDLENQMWGQVDRAPVEGKFLTKHWYPGETVVDEYEIAVNPETPSGVYFLEVGMYDLLTKERLPTVGDDGERLGDRMLLKTPLVVGGDRVFEVPKEIQHPMSVNLDDKVTLLGYDLAETEDLGETSSSPSATLRTGSVETLSRAVKPGGTLHLTLYWQARKRMDTSYKVFTHLLDSEERIWGQTDSVPRDGDYPTTGWLPGEVIVDEYEISVQSDAPSEEYKIEIGMYDLETMDRLPAFDEEGRRLPKDRVLLEPTIVVG